MHDTSRFLAYLDNAGGRTPEDFDEDWDPVGEAARARLSREGLIRLTPEGFLKLTVEGRRQLNSAMGDA